MKWWKSCGFFSKKTENFDLLISEILDCSSPMMGSCPYNKKFEWQGKYCNMSCTGSNSSPRRGWNSNPKWCSAIFEDLNDCSLCPFGKINISHT